MKNEENEENPENIAEMLMSERSSMLDSEKLALKRKNENFAYTLGIFTQIIWSINGLQMKTFQQYFMNDFTNNSAVFWRSLPLAPLAYIICKKNRIHITSHSEVKHIIWFYFRYLGNYVTISLGIKLFSYFRLSTGTVITGCTPLLVIIFAVIFLGERFYLRYLLGVLICILGSSIIVFNDKKPQSRQTILDDNLFMGIIVAISQLIFLALNFTGQKFMVKEKMENNVQNFYLGVYNALPAFIFCLIDRNFGFSNMKYVLYCMSNGFIFYLGNYLTVICLKYIALSKYQPVTYLALVFTFIIAGVILGEAIYFTDILGALFIIGFQFYNMKFPPQVQRHINEKEDNMENIVKESDDNVNNHK